MEQLQDSRQAGAIEVTPAMIEAGSVALSHYSETYPEDQLAVVVYTAMERLRISAIQDAGAHPAYPVA